MRQSWRRCHHHLKLRSLNQYSTLDMLLLPFSWTRICILWEENILVVFSLGKYPLNPWLWTKVRCNATPHFSGNKICSTSVKVSVVFSDVFSVRCRFPPTKLYPEANFETLITNMTLIFIFKVTLKVKTEVIKRDAGYRPEFLLGPVSSGLIGMIASLHG